MDWLEDWPQAGDAGDYLLKGEACAHRGECFHQLRPVISLLWFSLPHRLGLPATAILVLHALLLLLSISFSVKAILSATGRTLYFPRLQWVLLAAASFCIHAIFLWPTFFNSLTDTPAALLTLCGLSMMAWLQNGNFRFRGAGYFGAGLLMGFAEGLRIFYLYPLLVFLVLQICMAIFFTKKRDWKKLFVLSALFPVLSQNLSTFYHAGEVSHLPSSPQVESWSNTHLASNYSGYDTLSTERGYPWFNGPCAVAKGVWESWQDNDWRQLSCLIGGRIYFLLGSYSRHTYYKVVNIPVEEVIMPDQLVVVDDAHWQDPHSGGATIFRVESGSGGGGWEILTSAMFKKESVTIGLTTQSDNIGSSLIMRLKSADNLVVAEKLMPMTAKPYRHFLHAHIPSAGKYVLSVGVDHENLAPVIFQTGDLNITPSEEEEEYPVASSKVRSWSLLLLAVHVSMVIAVFVYAFTEARKCSCWIVIMALPVLLFLQALVVIPEQRFIIVTDIFLWLFVVGFINLYFIKLEKRAANYLNAPALQVQIGNA